MIGVYDVAAVRAAEAAAMEDVPDGALMQRASFGLANESLAALTARYGSAYGRDVVLLVGSGGNGGDALYAGLFLSRRGCRVRAVLTAPDRVFTGALEAFRAARLPTVDASSEDVPDLIAAADLVIDGVVGLGARGSVRLPADVLTAWSERRGIAVAVDLPSGLDVDTGVAYEHLLDADLTVTFGAFKPAHVLAPARRHCGRVALVDIGLGAHLDQPAIEVLEDADVAEIWPVQPYDGNKYSTGVVTVLAGSDTYSGAALLSVGGAVRAKPGMTRFVGTGAVAGLVRATWPEVVVSESVSTAGRTNAYVVGPGMGTDDAAGELLREVLAQDTPVVIDADGLTLLGSDLALLERSAPTVLTPHSGEFERVFGPVGADPVARVREVAAEHGVVVLLKGATTIVADPAGRTFVNPTGTPDLATAGTGDVLSGILGALLAADIDPGLAAGSAAYVHGLLGASSISPVIAEDLVRALPHVVTRLRRHRST